MGWLVESYFFPKARIVQFNLTYELHLINELRNIFEKIMFGIFGSGYE